jgi:hypothetical protein
MSDLLALFDETEADVDGNAVRLDLIEINRSAFLRVLRHMPNVTRPRA